MVTTHYGTTQVNFRCDPLINFKLKQRLVMLGACVTLGRHASHTVAIVGTFFTAVWGAAYRAGLPVRHRAVAVLLRRGGQHSGRLAVVLTLCCDTVGGALTPCYPVLRNRQVQSAGPGAGLGQGVDP
jgi:hypothetical protein